MTSNARFHAGFKVEMPGGRPRRDRRFLSRVKENFDMDFSFLVAAARRQRAETLGISHKKGSRKGRRLSRAPRAFRDTFSLSLPSLGQVVFSTSRMHSSRV